MAKTTGMIQVSVNQTTLNDLQKKMNRLTSQGRKAVSNAAAVALVGDKSKGLKHYPPHKHILRSVAYGKTFFTKKQRRYFFWAKRQGIIKKPSAANRTFDMQRGWKITATRSGARVYNTEPHAKFSHSDNQQARLNKHVGWRRVSDIEREMQAEMVKAGEKAIDDLIDN